MSSIVRGFLKEFTSAALDRCYCSKSFSRLILMDLGWRVSPKSDSRILFCLIYKFYLISALRFVILFQNLLLGDTTNLLGLLCTFLGDMGVVTVFLNFCVTFTVYMESLTLIS